MLKEFLNRTGTFVVSEKRSCPVCKTPHLDRIPRRFIDRVLSIFVPVKRYSCPGCHWEGNLKIE